MSALLHPRWRALSPARQQELLNEHRGREVFDNWWDSTYEQFKDDCKDVGIDVRWMYFSGFWSQGDGASFVGQIYSWEKYLKATGKERLLEVARQCNWSYSTSIDTYGNYCHSGTMRATADIALTDDLINPYNEDDEILQHDAWKLAHPGIPTDLELAQIEDSITLDFRTRADALYRRLEEEYEHLTSDETVAERLLDEMSDEELRGGDEDGEDSVDETEALFPPS